VIRSGGWRILEIRVDIQNISRKNWFVPAAYISARPLISKDRERGLGTTSIKLHKSGEIDFKKLPEHDELRVRNLAAFENTMVKLSPDEAEILVGWYVLDDRFVEQVPVVVVNLEVFGASSDYLNTKEHRNEFLRLIDADGGIRHSYIMFGRWSVLDEDKRRAGKYYMIRPPMGEQHSDSGVSYDPRDERTGEYQEFLESMAGWSRQSVVSLVGEGESTERERDPAYPNRPVM
jgi:hypothetical protein